jgi:cob(I)alamin adenosyltransferase
LLDHGYIQIYTGDGKGKTTASLGLALRALGHGWKVLIIQFTKGDSATSYGEIASSLKFDNLEVMQFGMDRVAYSHNVSMEDYKVANRGWELA